MFDPAVWSPRLLAVLRIIAALLFIEHATMKFFSFPVAMQGLPHPLPAIMIVAGIIEIVTSAMIILGLFTRIAAFIASGEMAVAYFMAHMPMSFWPTVNQGEMAIMFCFVFLYLSAAGGGAWTVDERRLSFKSPQTA